MSKNEADLKSKICRKIHHIVFARLKMENFLRDKYPSVRHARKCKPGPGDYSNLYFTQLPNSGAGIGHQLSNYISGLHYAGVFGLKHAAAHFTDKKWDEFFGFYENRICVQDLLKQGYSMVRLPYFDEKKDYAFIKNIIDSYSGEKVIFQTELDQFYRNQYEEIPLLKQLFEEAQARKSDKSIFEKNKINLAVHIRRGDITGSECSDRAVTEKRWITLDYYLNIVKQVSEALETEGGKRLEIYIFSQGNADEYRAFEEYGHVNYCLDMDAETSFLAMVRADILVTSKSSFSYNPALLSDGIRICPRDFWHGYPEDSKWILADENGCIADNDMKTLKTNYPCL